MTTEAALRDELASKLSLIEPGLTLIETEHPLPNTLGAKGFIDILARDRFGNRVIIELKRSNQTARQALHEVLKYVPLFVGCHGLPRHPGRCPGYGFQFFRLELTVIQRATRRGFSRGACHLPGFSMYPWYRPM